MAAVFASSVFKNPARYHFSLKYGKGGWQEKNKQQASNYYLRTDIGEEERVVNECQLKGPLRLNKLNGRFENWECIYFQGPSC